MIRHISINATDLGKLIRQDAIHLAGNSVLKIYGSLHCRSGKRMKRANRVFFHSEREALEQGYRPCGHCLKGKYITWKHGLI